MSAVIASCSRKYLGKEKGEDGLGGRIAEFVNNRKLIDVSLSFSLGLANRDWGFATLREAEVH